MWDERMEEGVGCVGVTLSQRPRGRRLVLIRARYQATEKACRTCAAVSMRISDVRC